jgi:hypothetical protein
LPAQVLDRFDALVGRAAQPEGQIVARQLLAEVLFADDLLNHETILSDQRPQLNAA